MKKEITFTKREFREYIKEHIECANAKYLDDVEDGFKFMIEVLCNMDAIDFDARYNLKKFTEAVAACRREDIKDE